MMHMTNVLVPKRNAVLCGGLWQVTPSQYELSLSRCPFRPTIHWSVVGAIPDCRTLNQKTGDTYEGCQSSKYAIVRPLSSLLPFIVGSRFEDVITVGPIPYDKDSVIFIPSGEVHVFVKECAQGQARIHGYNGNLVDEVRSWITINTPWKIIKNSFGAFLPSQHPIDPFRVDEEYIRARIAEVTQDNVESVMSDKRKVDQLRLYSITYQDDSVKVDFTARICRIGEEWGLATEKVIFNVQTPIAILEDESLCVLSVPQSRLMFHKTSLFNHLEEELDKKVPDVLICEQLLTDMKLEANQEIKVRNLMRVSLAHHVFPCEMLMRGTMEVVESCMLICQSPFDIFCEYIQK